MNRNKPMRVLHLLKTTRGAAWALRQMRELVSLGVEVHVVLPAYSGNASAYTAAGITVHPVDLDLSLKSMVNLPRQLHGLNSVLKKIRPDLV
ncbi:MAG: glycosyltransferase, partial [Desulfobacteraceae bacterium]|nr:glycosyltransferase [Desulfobacteraceae bacterium]